MTKRNLGPFIVNPVGLGCMSLSYAYGTPPSDAGGEALLHRALDLGYDFLDTAALYGVGHNETLIGRALMSTRACRGSVSIRSICITSTGSTRRRRSRSRSGRSPTP
jgi:aryl-alcohol dehydrogenase-like predicted oxidoreductase